jgi:F-type H+-transporting ATPase subunit b
MTAAIAGTFDRVLLLGNGVLVDFDATLFFLIFLFLALLITFNFILVRPYLKIRETRQERIQGARAASKQVEQRAREIFAQYEDKLTSAVREGEAERRVIRDQAKREQRDVLTEARLHMDETVRVAKVEMDMELGQAETDLLDHARALAADIVEKVLAP